MDIFLKFTLLSAGVFMVVISLINNTYNFKSSLVYKVLPMLLGLACLVSMLYVFGLLKGAG